MLVNAPRARVGGRLSSSNGIIAALALVIAMSSAVHAACPPHGLVLSTIRAARSVQVQRLGSRSERDVDWQSDDPHVFLGYEVLDSNPLLPAEVAALAKVLASPASYDCKAVGRALIPTLDAVDIGFALHSDVAAVRVVFYMNEGQMELEFFNGAHTRSGLSTAGHRSLERLLDAYAIRTAGSRKAWNERMGAWRAPGAPPPVGSREAANGVDLMPDPLVRVPPHYSDRARETGVDGTVLVKARVNTVGVVDSIVVINSIPLLDEAAITAARQWRFRPAQKAGQPASAWVEIPVKFSLH